MPPVAIAPSDGEAQFSVAKTLGSILFVLALILVIAFCLKRYMPYRFGTGGKKRFIQILENVSLGEKRSLTLIRIDQENLLLASTSTSISLIKKIDLRPPVESTEDEHTINRSKRNPAERIGLASEIEHATGTQPDHATFRDLMTSQLNDFRVTSREGMHPVLSKLSQIRKELRTRLGSS
jgi:flagellar biosynthetic protein FliO